jgi:hypothetical protein
MSKFIHLSFYSITLLWLSIYEFFSCRRELNQTIKRTLSPKQIAELKSVLKSVYLNLGFTRTIIAEYARLQINSPKLARKMSIYASAIMLLDDILLDEALSASSYNSIVKLISALDSELANMWDKVSTEVYSRQLDLLKSLHQAQLDDDRLGKGLWLPALSFAYNPQMDKQEIEILQDLGLWMKNLDDWADVEQDIAAGKDTMFTRLSYSEAMKEMEAQRQDVFTRFKTLPYPSNIKSEFLYRLSVQGICFVAFNQDLNGKLRGLKQLAHDHLIVSLFAIFLSSRLVFNRLWRIS